MKRSERKTAIRRLMRARRKALTHEDRERAAMAVCARLLGDGAIANATDKPGGGTVAVYLASPEEIDLAGFILGMLERGVNVVAPRWNGETYEMSKVKGLSASSLRRGPMNIPEPAEADIVKPPDVDAWIVPGLAFTGDGSRIGYGGGWYDRLLASAAERAVKIGVAHEFQVLGDLPREPHDIRLDAIVTDSP